MLVFNVMASWLIKWSSVTVLFSSVMLGTPPIANAQSDTERAGARAAAEAGLSAYNAGRYSEAYDLLSRAESLVHALPHLLYMARSSEKLAHLVQAREIYLKIAREQLIAGAPRAFIEAQQAAQQELATVEARLPYLTVTLDGVRANDVKVTMDDREIPSVLIGVPFPVDPGNHIVVVTSTLGQRGEPAKVSMSEGKRERIALRLTAANSAAPAPIPTQPVSSSLATNDALANPQPAPTKTATSSSPEGKDKSSSGSSPILAYTALGVGVAGAAIGTVFLIQRSSKQSDADSAFNQCTSQLCTDSEKSNVINLDKGAATAGTISLVGFGVGAAALTAGLYLLFTGDSKPAAATQARRFEPFIGPMQAGATLRF